MQFLSVLLERADLLAVLYVMFACFCHSPIRCLGQMWSLIVSFPDICLPLNYLDFTFKSFNCSVFLFYVQFDQIPSQKYALIFYAHYNYA